MESSGCLENFYSETGFKDDRMNRRKRGSVLLREAGRFLSGLVLFLFGCLQVQAGADSLSSVAVGGRDNALHLVGEYAEGKVYLRWAAASYPIWQHVLEEGVVLERFEFDGRELEAFSLRGDTMPAKIPYPERKEIPLLPFLAQDTARLSLLARENSYAALLGEAVYAPVLHFGFGNAVPMSGWASIKAKMEQEAVRFVLANLAYDRSFPVACLGGMGYVDSQLKEGNYYLYRLSLRGKPDSGKDWNDTAVFFTRQEPLLQASAMPVRDLKVEFGDRSARLLWPGYEKGFPCAGYFIERARAKGAGAGKFERLNQEPYSDFVQNAGRWLSYTDSLPENGTAYRYRVLALDLFGKERLVAVSPEGEGKERLESCARIDSLTEDRRFFHLHWSFPQAEQDLVESFSLHSLPRPSDTLPEESLLASASSKARSCRISKEAFPLSGYLYVVAHGKSGKDKVSLPFFHQQADSIPPSVPSGLKGEVDSAASLRLVWNPVPEQDCAGYRVFFRIGPDSEPVQLTKGPLADTVFFDTLSRITCQEFQYAVCSEDRRGNRSDFSNWINVDNGRPRKPVPPVFLFDCPADARQVELRWQNSPSDFVQGQALLYKVDSSSWIPVKDFVRSLPGEELPDSHVFRFPPSDYDRKYMFRLLAYGSDRDSDTAYSPFPFTVFQFADVKVPAPMLLADRENRFVHVQWRFPRRGDVERVCIFRQKEEDKLLLLSCIGKEEAREGYYVDASVEMNMRYVYRIQMVFGDGTWSEVSAPASVEY